MEVGVALTAKLKGVTFTSSFGVLLAFLSVSMIGDYSFRRKYGLMSKSAGVTRC